MKLGGGGPLGGGLGILVRVLIFKVLFQLFALIRCNVRDRKETSSANKRDGYGVHQKWLFAGTGASRRPSPD
jgi:hypothetical protein